MSEKIFIKGVITKKPHERAPDFVIANVAINVGDFLHFANEHSKRGWINFQIKESSKEGKFYAELDTYEPKNPPSAGGNDKEFEKTIQVEDKVTSKGHNGEVIDTSEIPF